MLLEKRIPFTYVFGSVWRDVLAVVAIAIVIQLVLHFGGDDLLTIPPSIPAFLGTAISLLLSFKLNQSYDRWWEARKIWGAIVNDSRTLVRQLLSFAGEDSDVVRRMGLRQVAWCYCLGQSLRGLDWKIGAIDHLSADDAEWVGRHRNRPAALLQLQATDTRRLAEAERLTDFQRVAVDETLSRLTNWMGMAERIKNTVFPKTYRLLLRGFMYLFITALSMALFKFDDAWQIGITTVIAIPFLLLEQTAFLMQDPFENRPSDTSVTAIARTIEINLRQLLGDETVPEPLAAEDFYVM